MCKFLSAIVKSNCDIICRPEYTDSHEVLIKAYNLRTSEIAERSYVRVEFVPQGDYDDAEKYALTEFSWRNFFLGQRVQPEPQDGDEDDFWDPKSYNPLDKGPEMTAEQLKAWDFLQQQKQGSSPSPEFHSPDTTRPTKLS